VQQIKENNMSELDKKPTAENIAKNYSAMGDSVELINGIINGSKMKYENAQNKKNTVKRNVEHLEIMVAKDYWTNEDMTAVNAAITSGTAYIA
jgi:hypothetical protein